MTDIKKPSAGDVVKLKSGGPKMTVKTVGEHVGTVWFNDQGVVCTAMFPAACLIVVGGTDGKL